MKRVKKMSVLRRARHSFRPVFGGLGRPASTAVGATIASTVLDLAKPWPAAFVIDRVLAGGDASRGDVVLLIAAGVVSGAIGLVGGQLSFLSSLKAAEVAKTATTRLRRMVFEHLNRLALPFHASSRTGDLLIRLIGDVALVRDLLFTSWITLLDFGLQLVGLVVIMAILDPPVVAALAGPLLYLWVTSRESAREMKAAVRLQRKSQGAAAAMAAETLSQIRVIKAYGAEDLAVSTFNETSVKEEGEGFRAARIGADIERRMEGLAGWGSGIVLAVGGLRVLAGAITVGDLVVLVSYGKSLFKPLRKLSAEIARLAKAAAVTERILDILDREPEDPRLGAGVSSFRGEIEFRDVQYGYSPHRRVLDGASLVIPEGRLVALVGANGEGKSTVLSLLLRLFEPEGGQISIDGRSIAEFRLDEYRRRMAYVPQDLRLFAGSVADNIRFGKPDATDVEISAAVGAAHFADVVGRLCGGMATELGEGGATLSGGEARRLMLARAAARQADVLLLDEPFAGLDPESRPAVARSIRGIAAGRTTIVVAHGDLDDLDPDMVVRLRDGKLEAYQPLLATGL
ncbi:MAG: ABC transporter ATP-binding protein/permease [Acidimicrobiia bacterium]|nr:ABC transporter ATP-binding protein/permease [Acidimicrobiia bacterium]MDH4309981.1 ABC transporter ATP-binding protein/permease [Acidimicrobiia bacterium]MDH5294579.1 ABC transporter ATP-binding protein/permease [Acidimicrobiia bacterium]